MTGDLHDPEANRLIGEILSAWDGGDPDPDLTELVSRALHSFDTRYVVVSLSAIAASFIAFAAKNEGVDESVIRDRVAVAWSHHPTPIHQGDPR